jgi:hypothetical protein
LRADARAPFRRNSNSSRTNASGSLASTAVTPRLLSVVIACPRSLISPTKRFTWSTLVMLPAVSCASRRLIALRSWIAKVWAASTKLRSSRIPRRLIVASCTWQLRSVTLGCRSFGCVHTARVVMTSRRHRSNNS